MKTFTYKDYKNCYFIVGSYIRNNMAMEIRIENAEGAIMECTIYDDSFFYTPSIVAIKNYSENLNGFIFLLLYYFCFMQIITAIRLYNLLF